MVTRAGMRDFYAIPVIRNRIREYLGADCVYLAQPDQDGWPRLDRIRSSGELDALLDSGADLSRSLWDRRALIAHLDIEYVNADFPHEVYYDPVRAFQMQRPVCAAVEKILERCGIDALHMLSGRGHHYVWRIDRQSPVFRDLARLGRCNDTLLARYRHTGIPFAARVPEPLGYAFAGLGLVMEYLAGRIKHDAGRVAPIPVELTDVRVGAGERGREMISLDISEYGDPLYLRLIRIPFTAYRKPGAETVPQTLAGSGMIVTAIAPSAEPADREIPVMHDLNHAAQAAEQCTAAVPEASGGTAALLAEYRTADLCAFHDAFYRQRAHPPERWAATYDRLPPDSLPPCAARVLADPNDLLMKPACIEHVVRVLLATGWQARHAAGLIRSRYERDYGWGTQWLIHDAATRADFYTRIFAGLFFSGVDDLVDFNCRSIQEKGLCCRPCERCDIASLQAALLERRNHV